MMAHLRAIGLEVNEALGLFKLLDVDETNEVSIQEFVVGCMRLKGGAKSIDLATLMYENKRTMERFKTFEDFCRDRFGRLFRCMVMASPEVASILADMDDGKHVRERASLRGN